MTAGDEATGEKAKLVVKEAGKEVLEVSKDKGVTVKENDVDVVSVKYNSASEEAEIVTKDKVTGKMKAAIGANKGFVAYDNNEVQTVGLSGDEGLSLSKDGVKRAELKVAANDDAELNLKDSGENVRVVASAKGAVPAGRRLGAATCLSPVLLLPHVDCAHLSPCFLQARLARTRSPLARTLT